MMILKVVFWCSRDDCDDSMTTVVGLGAIWTRSDLLAEAARLARQKGWSITKRGDYCRDHAKRRTR